SSYPQYLEAATAARRVAGVTGVHNNLMVVLTDSDYRDGVQLTTAANSALANNVTMPAQGEAAADAGKITVGGTAGDPPQWAGGGGNGRFRSDRWPQRRKRHRHQLRHRSRQRRLARPGGP